MTTHSPTSRASVEVLELARLVGVELAASSPCGSGWTTHANRTLATVSRNSLVAGCLAFRVLSNTVRLAGALDSGAPFVGTAAYGRVTSSLGAGRLLVTGLLPERTAATTSGGRVRVSASGLLVTGIAYADHLLLQTHIDDDSDPSLVVVPTTAITYARRPAMRGLQTADNVIVSVDTVLPLDEALFSVRGAGRELVEAPYAAGLTFGAVAQGGLLALCDAVACMLPTENAVLGHGLVDATAASALVEASSAAHGHASALSRAAKVFATTAADRFAAAATVAVGPAAYATEHPITSLADDLAGLAFQAPTNRGATGWLARRAGELLVRHDATERSR